MTETYKIMQGIKRMETFFIFMPFPITKTHSVKLIGSGFRILKGKDFLE